ncbi:MAG: group 1 glycosyl transferase, partial [Bacteroidota bacterium]
MSKRKLLIISFSNLKSDPRVKRQIHYFKDFYDITTVGFADSEIENVKHIDVFSPFNKMNFIIPLPKLLLGMFESYYWNLEEIKLTLEKIIGKQFDFILANDADALPVALKIKGTAKVIFDAHEYSPEENNDSLRWRFLFKKYKTNLIRKYAQKADFMLTVCDGIAKKYNTEFGLNPMVLTNAADYFENTVSMKVGSKIKMMHHGLALPQRKIENMIEMMDFVDERFELDLMLVFRKQEYKKELEQLIGTKKNVRLIPPVSADEIVPFISHYDFGIYILEPT